MFNFVKEVLRVYRERFGSFGAIIGMLLTAASIGTLAWLVEAFVRGGMDGMEILGWIVVALSIAVLAVPLIFLAVSIGEIRRNILDARAAKAERQDFEMERLAKALSEGIERSGVWNVSTQATNMLSHCRGKLGLFGGSKKAKEKINRQLVKVFGEGRALIRDLGAKDFELLPGLRKDADRSVFALRFWVFDVRGPVAVFHFDTRVKKAKAWLEWSAPVPTPKM